jgi:NADPH-dependent curcumin reductase CurA
MKTKEIILARRPQGVPEKEVFHFQEKTLPSLQTDQVLLKPLLISVDPYLRGRMNDAKSYAPPFEVGAAIESAAVAEVLESKSPLFKTGETVIGFLPWALKCILPARNLKSIDTNIAPAGYYLGILGMPGLTAYFGLMDIGKPKAGETLVVSGAAGAVGLVVGQIGKLKGCRVIGIAGSPQKCRMLKEEFGFDEAIDYRMEPKMAEALKRTCPDGVDVYFDNVGGEITDAVISRINFHSRIVLCGQIAQYNDAKATSGPRFLSHILTRSALIQGFIISNYKERFGEGMKDLASWLKEGKLKYKETELLGFEQLPDAFLGLFSGKSVGKMLVRVAEGPLTEIR